MCVAEIQNAGRNALFGKHAIRANRRSIGGLGPRDTALAETAKSLLRRLRAVDDTY